MVAAIAAIALISAAILSPGVLTLGSTSTAQLAPSGTLAVVLTDPPTIPEGTTAVYATYSDVQVHVAEAGNQSGWYDLHSSGQINLMSVINIGQTIGSASVPSGLYNALRFNVTSAIVTFQGQNYTAHIASSTSNGGSELTVPIIGGIQVQSGVTSAAVIDMTPTVILGGNSTNPEFAFVNSARAYTMPANSIPRDIIERYHHVNLTSQGWWDKIMDSQHYQVTATSLTPNSLSITVDNTGNVSVVYRYAAVTATQTQHGGDVGRASISEYFVVEPNASLIAVQGSTPMQLAWTLAAGGYLLPPGSSVTFTYSGPIMLGTSMILPVATSAGTSAATATAPPTTAQPVIPGQGYVITIRGDGLPAKTEVIAGPSPVS
jgi:hypothetical protein